MSSLARSRLTVRLPQTLASVVPPFNRLLVNAGIMQGAETLLDESDSTTTEDLLRMLDVNVVAPVKTIRALLPVLKKADTSAEDGKKILLMSSQLGSIDLVGQWSASTKGGYSVSKVSRAHSREQSRADFGAPPQSALNMAGRKMGVELEGTGVSLMLMHPGWVKTVSSASHSSSRHRRVLFRPFADHSSFIQELGGDDAPVEKKDSIAGMLKVLETAGNGSYLDFEGNKLNW